MHKVVLKELIHDIEEGVVDYWCFEEGDSVAEGDDLVQIETDEGPCMVASPFSGVVREIFYTEGESVGLGDVLCEIDDEDAEQ